MYTSCYTSLHIHFRLQAAIFDFSLTMTSDVTSIRPTILFDTNKICGFRWTFTHIPFLISKACSSGFTYVIVISGWSRIAFCTRRWCHYSNGDFGILKNKCRNVEFAPRWFTPFDSMINMRITVWTRTHLRNLHFRWHLPIMGWRYFENLIAI